MRTPVTYYFNMIKDSRILLFIISRRRVLLFGSVIVSYCLIMIGSYYLSNCNSYCSDHNYLVSLIMIIVSFLAFYFIFLISWRCVIYNFAIVHKSWIWSFVWKFLLEQMIYGIRLQLSLKDNHRYFYLFIRNCQLTSPLFLCLRSKNY